MGRNSMPFWPGQGDFMVVLPVVQVVVKDGEVVVAEMVGQEGSRFIHCFLQLFRI